MPLRPAPWQIRRYPRGYTGNSARAERPYFTGVSRSHFNVAEREGFDPPMKVPKADGRLPGGQTSLPLAQLPSLDGPLGVKIAATFESENVDDPQRGNKTGADRADFPSCPYRRAKAASLPCHADRKLCIYV